jgi:MFS family permease
MVVSLLPMSMRELLSNRDFRRLFVGRLVTNAGDSLYYIAAMWLVWELTKNPLYSGIAGFLTMAPQALQFLFGPLVDRWDVRNILVRTQATQAVLVLVVPLAAYTGHLSALLVLALMPVLSMLNQLVYPAQSSALPRIVEQDELVEANSAFSLAYQGVDMVFNATAGVIVALFGAVTLYTVDSVTFVAAAMLFAGVHVPPAASSDDEADAATEGPDGTGKPGAAADGSPDSGMAADGDAPTEPDPVATDGGPNQDADGDELPGPAAESLSYVADLKEGLAFLRGTVLVLVVVGAAFVNFAGGGLMAALPAFADAVGGAGAYGLLTAAFAAGNLSGAVLAGRLDHYPFGWLSIACFAVSGVAWTAAIAVSWVPATALLLGLSSVPMGITNVLLSSLVQAAVPEDKLGRVSSVLGSAATFGMPFGMLAGGAVAGAFGPRAAMGAGGVAVLLFAGYWLILPSLRTLPAVGDIDTLARETAA